MKIFDKLLDVINPQGIKCVICGRDLPREMHGVCDKCKALLPFNGKVCLKCGVDIRSMENYCDACVYQPPSFDAARSVCRYERYAQKLIHRLKFGGQKYLARPMAYLMCDVLKEQNWQFDAVTYIPASARTIKKRGYNQAELIAREICDIINKPCLTLLSKTKEAAPQEEMSLKERFENMVGAFAACEKPPACVLVIDDVKTTGATLNAAASVLKKAGAKTVCCLTFAANVRK